MKSRIMRITVSFVCAVALIMGIPAVQIIYSSGLNDNPQGDAVFVLGAAAYGHNPSPVFRERIIHAMNLYRSGKCRLIILTGGKKFVDDFGEANAAREFLIKNKIPKRDILIETVSSNTYENFYYAVPLLRKAGIDKIIIVSDPYHMKRASIIADDFSLSYSLSPTPSSKFTSLEQKFPFLVGEIYNIYEYRLFTLVKYLSGK